MAQRTKKKKTAPNYSADTLALRIVLGLILIGLGVCVFLAVDMGIAKELYMFALLVGSCLGGNLTPYGASANVVAMGILKKEGYPINFGGWLKIAGTFTVFTTAVSAIVLWLLWA